MKEELWAVVWTGMRNSIAGHGSNASRKGLWENKDSTKYEHNKRKRQRGKNSKGCITIYNDKGATPSFFAFFIASLH